MGRYLYLGSDYFFFQIHFLALFFIAVKTADNAAPFFLQTSKSDVFCNVFDLTSIFVLGSWEVRAVGI